MKLKSQIEYFKQCAQIREVMKNVKATEQRSRKMKQKRIDAFISHTKAGYFPPQPKKTLKMKSQEFFENLKQVIARFDE